MVLASDLVVGNTYILPDGTTAVLIEKEALGFRVNPKYNGSMENNSIMASQFGKEPTYNLVFLHKDILSSTEYGEVSMGGKRKTRRHKARKIHRKKSNRRH